jgi:16S rRNA (uracil1498-N3)-methyltransferase
MTPPRFYLPPERCAGTALRLDGREAHHALCVLRVQRGEPVMVLDGAGHELSCEVAGCARNAVDLRVTGKNSVPPLPCSITLLQAVPKGKVIEFIIQKAVELGVHRIVPLLTERVVARLDEADAADKRDKWQHVAIEAIKQCGAAWLPQVETPATIEAFLKRRNSEFKSRPQPSTFELSLVGSLQTDRRHPRECFREFQTKHGRLPQSVGVWIGPEGDFTRNELKAIQATGAQPISLGSLVLRVETAATYCLSILNYELAALESRL